MPFDIPVEDDQEQDEQQGGSDPVTTIASYLNPDRTKDGDQKDWGSLFSRVASGPRIQPPAADASDANAADDGAAGATAAPGTQGSATATPADDASSQSAPGWESSFDDSPSSTIDQNPAASDVENPATPDAKDALGDFAAATGTGNQTQLGNLAQPPTAPAMDPDFAKTQADLRAKIPVTAKYDPVTGKTLDQYKIGTGGRIGRALQDFGMGLLNGKGLLGATGDTLRGAFGDRNAPGYYGKGAVNGQYGRDEQQRQRDVTADESRIKSFEDENTRASDTFKNQQSSWKDAFDVAHQGKEDAIRQQNADEKSRHDQETEDLKSQLQDAKDPAQKLKAESDARGAIGKQLGLTGEALQRYSLYGDKSSMDEVNAGKAKNAEDRIGLQNDRNKMEQDKIDAAKAKNATTFKDSAAIDKYSDQWYLKQRDQVRKDKAEALKNAGGKDVPQDEYTSIEAAYKQRTQEFENRKQQWYGQVNSGKPVTVQNTDQGIPDVAPKATPPADTTDIPAAEFNPRTGDPVAGITATNPDGTPGKAVVSGKKDASGRPTIELQQPGATPPKPATQLAPMPDKSVKTAGGRVLNIGDNIPGHGTIKGFGKDPTTQKVSAMF